MANIGGLDAFQCLVVLETDGIPNILMGVNIQTGAGMREKRIEGDRDKAIERAVEKEREKEK